MKKSQATPSFHGESLEITHLLILILFSEGSLQNYEAQRGGPPPPSPPTL